MHYLVHRHQNVRYKKVVILFYFIFFKKSNLTLQQTMCKSKNSTPVTPMSVTPLTSVTSKRLSKNSQLSASELSASELSASASQPPLSRKRKAAGATIEISEGDAGHYADPTDPDDPDDPDAGGEFAKPFQRLLDIEAALTRFMGEPKRRKR